eukprot:Skav218075  [mRNA]  locus=scaffold1832:159607:167038:- [translate_table: standard]
MSSHAMLTLLCMVSFWTASAWQPEVDPYEVLGLSRGKIESAALKQAYRKAALQWHPDKVPEAKKKEAEKRFIEISWAYEVLSDPVRRKEFDQPRRESGPSEPRGRKPHEAKRDFNMEKAAKVFKDVFGDSSPEYMELIEHLARSSATGSKEQWKRHAEAIRSEMERKGKSFSVETTSADGNEQIRTQQVVEDATYFKLALFGSCFERLCHRGASPSAVNANHQAALDAHQAAMEAHRKALEAHKAAHDAAHMASHGRQVTSRKTYDVWADPQTENTRLAGDINSLPDGRIVMVAAKDSGMENLDARAIAALWSTWLSHDALGAGATIPGGKEREGYALIGIKGGEALAEEQGGGGVGKRSIFCAALGECDDLLVVIEGGLSKVDPQGGVTYEDEMVERDGKPEEQGQSWQEAWHVQVTF